MENKMFWLLTISLILGLSQAVPSQYECNVDPKLRVNCGHPGITKEECLNNECCFESNIKGVPWCFRPGVEECAY